MLKISDLLKKLKNVGMIGLVRIKREIFFWFNKVKRGDYYEI